MKKYGAYVATGLFCAMLATPAAAVPIYLNNTNITVALGASHNTHVANNPTNGPFNDVTIARSLANIIDAPSATSNENHTSGGVGTHVWTTNKPLELDFDFGTEYDLIALHVWNYFTEQYDVDNIVFTFYGAGRNLVGSLSAEPRLGNAGGNPIIPESYTLNFPTNVRYVNAVLTGSNGEVDFNNIGFTAELSIPSAVPEPATWAMMIGGFGIVGGAMRRRARRVALA